MGTCIAPSIKPIDNISINQNGQITKRSNGTTGLHKSSDTIKISMQPKKSSLSKKRTKTHMDNGFGVFECWGSVRGDPKRSEQNPNPRLSPNHKKPPPHPKPNRTRTLLKPVFLRTKPRFASTPEVFELPELNYPDDGGSIGGVSFDDENGTSVSAISSQKSVSMRSMETVLTTVTHHSRAVSRRSDKVLVYPYIETPLNTKDPVQLTQDFTYYCYGATGPPTGRTLPIKPDSRSVSLREVPPERWKSSLEDLQAHQAQQLKQKLNELKEGRMEYDRESGVTDVSDRHSRALNELVEGSSVNSFQRSSAVRQHITPNRRRRPQSGLSGHGSTTRSSTYSNASSRVRLVATPEDDPDRDQAITAIHDELSLRRNINNWTTEAKVETLKGEEEEKEEMGEKEIELEVKVEVVEKESKMKKKKGKDRKKQKKGEREIIDPQLYMREPSPPGSWVGKTDIDIVSSDTEAGVMMVKEVTHAIIHTEPEDINEPVLHTKVVIEPQTTNEQYPEANKEIETNTGKNKEIDTQVQTKGETDTNESETLAERGIMVQSIEDEDLEAGVYTDPYEAKETPTETIKGMETNDEMKEETETYTENNNETEPKTERRKEAEKETEEEIATIVKLEEGRQIMVQSKEEEISYTDRIEEPQTLTMNEEKKHSDAEGVTHILVHPQHEEASETETRLTTVTNTDVTEETKTEENNKTGKRMDTVTKVTEVVEPETVPNRETVPNPEFEEGQAKYQETEHEADMEENVEQDLQEKKPEEKRKASRVKSPVPKPSKDPTSVIDVIISAATEALVSHMGVSTEPGVRRMLSVFRQGSSLAAGSAVVDHEKLSKSLLHIFSRALQTNGSEDTPVKDVREDINALDHQFYEEVEGLRREGNIQDTSVRCVFTYYQQKLNLLRVRGLRTSLLHKQKQREEEDGQLEQEARQLLVELDDVRRSIRDLRGKERQALDVRLMEKLRSKRHKVAPLDVTPPGVSHTVELPQ